MIYPVFSQNSTIFSPNTVSTQLVLDAEQAFYNKDFGKALKLANTGLVNRKAEVDWSLRILENATKTSPFQRLDDLKLIYEMILERDDQNAILLLENIFIKHGFEYFDNSFQNLISFIETQREYPELYFIIGKIYLIEGEWKLAEDYLLKAYQFASLLIVPSQKYDILYKLFDLYDLKNENGKQEQTLLLIIVDDPNYNQQETSTALIHTASRAIQTNTDLDKFFLLYHSESIFAMKAYYELSKIYNQDITHQKKALEVLSLAATSAFDRIESTVKQRVFDYRFESFESLLRLALKYDDIVDWIEDENVWAIFFNLAQAAKESNPDFSKSLLLQLSTYCSDSYWKKRSLEAYIN